MLSVVSGKPLSAPAILALLFALLLAGCTDGAVPEATVAATAQSALQEWLQPTPTLVPEVATAAAASPTPTGTPTPGPTSTATPSPTPTPLPAENVDIGKKLLDHGNYDEAARAFQAALSVPGALTRSEQEDALWGLSEAYRRDGRHSEALNALEQFMSLAGKGETGGGENPGVQAPATGGDERLAQVHFHEAEAQRALGDCAAAIAAYEAYLQIDATAEAYIQPRIAACHQELGDTDAAIAAYEAAVAAPAHRLTEVDTRLQLAELHLANENYAAAIAQYDAVRNLALTENTKGEMTYLAGRAEQEAGNEAAAHERFLQGVNDFPGSYHSYLGLVELIDAGVEVDPFQRGLVDYYAEAYEPAIPAFDSFIQANPDTYRADTRLYLAWCYEALGNLEAALAQLEAYGLYGASDEGAPHAAEAAVERGKMLARAGQTENAIAAYESVMADYPEGEEARFAAWQTAALVEQVGDVERARELYQTYAESYPAHEDAPRALYRAATIAWQTGDEADARGTWQQLANNYTQNDLGAAALVWLLRTAPEEERETYVVTATNLSGAGYYALRARDLANGVEPFEQMSGLELEPAGAQEQAEAEAWLAEWAATEGEEVSGEPADELAQDPRLVRGETLWRLGLFAEGKRELEDVRQAYARDALTTYQLAIYFRDMGLYRSSIIAADTLLALSGQDVFQAPRFIGRLSYPIYYQDLILELAEQYGYDPLLQFALVRQESLYESFIASHAGAQGLSQVMPATGQDIANRLGWPDYSVDDLHRPHVGLAFGAYYLAQQLEAFDGDVYAALSAYNGGPGNAARWHAQAPDDPDLYLEIVDFSETRAYIQRIYSGHAVYRWLYGDT